MGGAVAVTALYAAFLSSELKAEAGDSGPSGLKGMGKMGILRPHHVGAAVENLEEEARVYQEMFGCKLSEMEQRSGLRAIFAYVGGDEVELAEDHRPESFLKPEG